MRADTESLNSQFERAVYNRRLPAWGLHNQTVIVLIAALAQYAALESPDEPPPTMIRAGD